MRIRHSNMLHMANFLMTASEPKLVSLSLIAGCEAVCTDTLDSTTSHGNSDPTKKPALSNSLKTPRRRLTLSSTTSKSAADSEMPLLHVTTKVATTLLTT